MKRKGADSNKVAGRADAMARIDAWHAEASGEVAARLAALGDAVRAPLAFDAALAVRAPLAFDAALPWRDAPQHLRQDW